MKNKILFVLIFGVMIMFSQKVFASELCSKNGYTVLTINGVFTDKDGALLNKKELERKFLPTYNNQSLKFDYLHNPSHLAGIGDLVDVIAQGAFDQKSDYDLIEMLDGASEKVTTQKVLLVAHSQGNFYANNFYDKVSDKDGGIPSQSIGVYGVATPASKVAGGGGYLTSDTDKVISSLVSRLIKILPSNIHIALDKSDGDGHDFSKIYLKYQGDKIVSDIKSSLDKLTSNNIQIVNSSCISPQKISALHKVQGVMLAVADPVVNIIKGEVYGVYNVSSYIANTFKNISLALGKKVNVLLASAIESSPIISDITTLPLGMGDVNDIPITIDTENIKTEEVITSDNVDVEEKLDNTNEKVENNTPDISTESTIAKPETHHSSGGNNSTPEPVVEVVVIPEAEIIPVIIEEIPPVIIPPPIIIPVPEVTNNLVINKDTTLIAGEYNYDDLYITNNAKLILEGDQDSVNGFKGVKIIAKNITVDSGSYISADAKGYLDGPGASIPTENYAGATYGGNGDRNVSTPIYGSAVFPIDLGSGGYNNFRGGGAMQLIASNNIINNGVISANGDSTSSGGSIYIKAKSISGNGVFSTNGGGLYASSNYIGSGSGGRIALYYDDISFNGKAESLGGCGQYDGMTMTCAKNGTVGFFDVINNNLTINSSWLFQKSDNIFDFNKITFKNGAIVMSEKGTIIKANELLVDENSKFTLAEDQSINIPLIKINSGSTIIFSGKENLITNTLILDGNSNITIVPEQILSLHISTLTINTGSSIDVSAKGYLKGPGVATEYNGGASYGGIGGNNLSSSVYGSENEPIDFGSGGAYSSRGGGAIRIITDTLLNDGVISAGGDVSASGGSIYVTTNNLFGNGYFWANGGGPYCGGVCFNPGGGGRIAIHYKSNLFTGKLASDGSSSNSVGVSTAGTVKMIDSNIPILSSENLITAFDFKLLNPVVIGIIDNVNNKIELTVPYGTDLSELEPTIVISEKATISSGNMRRQDFRNPVVYEIRAENNARKSYTASVIVSPNPVVVIPDPVPVYVLPTISSYKLNGYQGNITLDPTGNPMTISIISNKDVNWMSVKIEKESNPKIYRIFQSSESCADWTSACQKGWNGELSSGELLSSKNYDGVYRVKVHIKDKEGNEYEDYLPSVINVKVL